MAGQGGETRRKVELDKLIEQLVASVKEANANEQISQKDKTTLYKRAAKSFKTQVHDDGRRNDEQRIALTTYRRYMTRARAAITAQNWRHHSLEQQVERIAKRWPQWGDRLREVCALDSIKALRMAHRDLLKEVRGEGPSDAYQAIADMKLDHEVMRHLSLPAAQKSELAESSETALELRSVNTVEISYQWLMATITDLITRCDRLIDGVYRPSMSRLSLGLALATGRRAWEVLAVGRFKKLGQYELEFSGQTKKRGGVDYSESYRIYTLIDADMVLEGFEVLRSLPEVEALDGLDNTEVNRRVAKTLNTTAKLVFGSRERVFKDSRAIWARIVFETHFSVDPAWRRVTEDVFWQSMLGHEDLDTQRSYKAFKVRYKQGTEQPEAETGSRLAALEALDDHKEIAGRAALAKLHAWIKETVAAEPATEITQSRITREVGTYRQAIREYLAIAGDALARSPVDVYSVAAPVPDEVAEQKPRLFARQDAEGWTGWATVNGVEVARVTGQESRLAAMKAAYETVTS